MIGPGAAAGGAGAGRADRADGARRSSEGAGRRGGFEEALARAGRREAERRGVERARGSGAGAAPGAALAEEVGPSVRGGQGGPVRSGAAGGPGGAPARSAARREGDGAGGPSAAEVAGLPRPPGVAGPAPVTMAAAVRAIVPAVELFRAGGERSLSLDFGRALGVEVSQAPGGIALLLAPSRELAPAARAELSGLVRALAARGVAVVRAEVRERGEGHRRGR